MSVDISINCLTKTFEEAIKPSLSNISAEIRAGKITGIVGPDGAGKTTLLRLMAAILLPSSGNVTIGGSNTKTDAEKIQASIGYMPQKFGLYEDLKVIENLQLYADLRGVPKEDIQDTFDKFLDFTNLQDFQKRIVGKLSGGMKQKLGLACALLKEPKVLLLDEPSVGVDPISRRELWSIVLNLVKEGTTVVWSTSYLDEAEKCDDVLVLSEGDLIFAGPPHKINERVKGRVYQSTKITGNKRNILQNIIKNSQVLDAVIKGEDLKVVLRENAQIADVTSSSSTWERVNPTFEDGFLDLLGGVRERSSGISELLEPIGQDNSKVIQAHNLKKIFGTFVAVNDVSFSVSRGEVFGFLGPNGAGKSTTFKMLCGLLKPSDGKATILDYDINYASFLARQKIGYMAQKFSLYGNLSTQQNLSFFFRLYGLSGDVQKSVISEMIEIFNLEPYLKFSSEALPLGFKQRLALACSLMHRPQILFLDEPTSGVDPLTRREFWMHINGMVQKGVTVMVTTHFIEEAEYCDRICLIYQGGIIALGTPDELKNMGKTEEDKAPTLEQAFINLIRAYDDKQ